MIQTLRNIAEVVRKNGLRLLYHPHNWEYEKLGGKPIIDLQLEGVGRDLMQVELELYWAAKAGLDPRQALLKYSGLSPLVHVKDMDAQGGFTEVGNGMLNWPSLFAAFDKTGVRYYFIEQDQSPNPLGSAFDLISGF